MPCRCKFFRASFLTGGLLFSALLGCGGGGGKPPTYMKSLVPTAGTVKVNGEPAAGVEVTFSPQSGIGGNEPGANVKSARAVTDQSGKYDLLTLPDGGTSSAEFSKFKGVLPGKYTATFTQWMMPDGKPYASLSSPGKGPMAMGAMNKLPEMVANPQSSKHRVEVKGSGANTFDFDLQGKK